MDRTKENFRRILDWEKDPDQNHWRTINGSHVHLDKNGNYDGGAGNKFNGRHHYGPGWRQKTSLMNRLHQALSQGDAKGAQRPNHGARLPGMVVKSRQRTRLSKISIPWKEAINR